MRKPPKNAFFINDNVTIFLNSHTWYARFRINKPELANGKKYITETLKTLDKQEAIDKSNELYMNISVLEEMNQKIKGKGWKIGIPVKKKIEKSKKETVTHYVYRLTHHNGEYYIGVRTCECDPYDDPYMGSSSRMKKEYKGRYDEFQKHIISIQETREESENLERLLVNKWQLSQLKCLNVVVGGHDFGTSDRDVLLYDVGSSKWIKADWRKYLSDEELDI
jgi:hypothetical protein